jgi:hypothetical protein
MQNLFKNIFKALTRIQEMETATETQIFRRLVQLKALFHRLMAAGDQHRQFSFHHRQLEHTQPMAAAVTVRPQVTFQQLHSVDPAILKPVPMHVLRQTIFTQSKTNIQQLIQATIEILKLVTSLTPQLPPDPQTQIVHHLHKPHKFHLKDLILIHIQSVLIPFPVIFPTFIHIIITISIMITSMTKIHIFQAFTHHIHHPCTTITTHHHTQTIIIIIMDREVACMPLGDIQKLTFIWATVEIVKLAIKLRITRQIFQCQNVSTEKKNIFILRQKVL